MLEGWIPATHQRPDIMFNYDDKQFVIEYQCTPIASEYVKRHELYDAAGITDIWILGRNNYHSTRTKVIENFAFGSYDTANNLLSLKGVKLKTNEINKLKLSYIANCVEKHNEKLRKEIERQENKAKIRNCILSKYPVVVNELNQMFKSICYFEFVNKKSDYYIAKIYCNFKSRSDSLTIFIKKNKFDVCYYDCLSCSYQNLYSVKYDTFNSISFCKMISMLTNRHVNKIKNRLED